ncbi:unnamed protein product [Arctia plantaginis]|uniref:Uncharacterized protein n=1 Tax=Arctia plantaginis TaxID=874455 RepID=A0A8S0Z3E7_ARCPL|nr:unnamed protein product [Arctia plantaginis]
MNSGYVRRQPPKVPKDGFGPRGVPDCYYTSRVLNSTFLYVQFVKKLRQQEEDDRIKDIREKIESKENCQQEFFIRCDRRRLINRTSIRVACCMQAYQDYLKERKQKLFEVLSAEEERNIRLLVESVQAGYELAWNAKMDRLNYLIAKRKKEHEEKYQDTPLSKSAHVLPCIYKIRRG